jgi:selenocysteine lyase/cysteine desulfurase
MFFTLFDLAVALVLVGLGFLLRLLTENTATTTTTPTTTAATTTTTTTSLLSLRPNGASGINWAAVRALYPMTYSRNYMNTGGLGPCTQVVLDTLFATKVQLQTAVETGHEMLEPVRQTVAAFVNCTPGELCFTRNATESTSIVAAGVVLSPGDEVIFDIEAHPGGYFPWVLQANRRGVKCLTFTPSYTSSQATIDRINALITPRTRVVSVSHITAPTGTLLPVSGIAALCRSKGIWFHVDGAQSLGMIPVDVRAIGCDSYSSSCHKWLGGPHGTGILYVRKDRIADCIPCEAGAYTDNGHANIIPSPYLQYNADCVRFEYGTRDVAEVRGVAAAIAVQVQIGPANIQQRGAELATLLYNQLLAVPTVTVLTPADPAMRNSIVTFKSSKLDYLAIYNFLSQPPWSYRLRIVTEIGLNAVRVSTHIFNNEAQVNNLVKGLYTALQAAN